MCIGDAHDVHLRGLRIMCTCDVHRRSTCYVHTRCTFAVHMKHVLRASVVHVWYARTMCT